MTKDENVFLRFTKPVKHRWFKVVYNIAKEKIAELKVNLFIFLGVYEKIYSYEEEILKDKVLRKNQNQKYFEKSGVFKIVPYVSKKVIRSVIIDKVILKSSEDIVIDNSCTMLRSRYEVGIKDLFYRNSKGEWERKSESNLLLNFCGKEAYVDIARMRKELKLVYEDFSYGYYTDGEEKAAERDVVQRLEEKFKEYITEGFRITDYIGFGRAGEKQ